MRLEIEKRVGRTLNDKRAKEIIAVDLPEENGVYQTGLGSIEVTVLERVPWNNRVLKIALEGEIMKGTPLKDKHKRNPRKVVSLNHGGRGLQTLSKRETIKVRREDLLDLEARIESQPKRKEERWDVHGGTGNPI